MTPYEQARQVYQQEPCARTFEEDLSLHLAHGYVFSTPDYFVMGRAVPRYANDADIVNPAVTWPEECCDCWHIYLMAGDVEKATARQPYPLPWLSREVNNKLSVHSFSALVRLVDYRKSIYL